MWCGPRPYHPLLTVCPALPPTLLCPLSCFYRICRNASARVAGARSLTLFTDRCGDYRNHQRTNSRPLRGGRQTVPQRRVSWCCLDCCSFCETCVVGFVGVRHVSQKPPRSLLNICILQVPHSARTGTDAFDADALRMMKDESVSGHNGCSS